MKKIARNQLISMISGIILIIVAFKIRPKEKGTDYYMGIDKETISSFLFLVGILLIGVPVFLGR